MSERNVEKVEHVTPDVVEGAIYFASNEAIRTRHLREGQRIKVATAGRKVHWLSETFVQIELSSSGRNYVHLDTRPASSIPPEPDDFIQCPHEAGRATCAGSCKCDCESCEPSRSTPVTRDAERPTEGEVG